MLPKILLEKMRDRDMSLREVAREIGISHTTVARILDNKAADIDTLDAVARWMNVPLVSILDLRLQGDDVVDQVRLAMSLYPELANVFRDILQGIISGDVEPRVLADVAAYTVFRIQQNKGSHDANTGSGTNILQND